MKQLCFGLFENAQANDSGTSTWRAPGHGRDRFDRLAYWRHIAGIAESGGLDFLFLADAWGWSEIDGHRPDVASEESLDLPRLDPATVLAALIPMTRDLGLVLTGSTLLEAPYAFARRLATLDHLSGGRIGWNVVTTGTAETAVAAFGAEMVGHDARYDMADDFAELAYKLFEGAWAADAIERDTAGRFADPAKVHRIRHDGPFFKCDGYGNAHRSPQGTPVIFQAGASSRGRRFAGRHGECVFLGGGAPDALADQIRSIRAEAADQGRAPHSVKFIGAVSCVTGQTEADARAKLDAIRAAQRPEVAVASYAMFTGLDLSRQSRETPMSALTTELSRSQIERFGSATVGDVLDGWHANGVRPAPFVGTPVAIADALCGLAETTGLDGFMLTPIVQPTCTADFLTHVLPELRARGAVTPPAAGATLRARLFGPGRDWLPADHPGARFRA